MAVAIHSQTAQSGVTQLQEGVNVGDFLTSQVLPELVDGNLAARPLAKAACIKFVATFRSIFTREQLHQLLPMLARLMTAENYLVHTYAAAAFERILTVKDRGVRRVAAEGGSGAAVDVPFCEPKVALEAVVPLATPALGALFTRMTAAGYSENEYLMRCVMRLVTVAKGHCAGAVGSIAGALGAILQRVCKNPSNPTFNHFMFESLASLMRTTCAANPALLPQFEGLLFPAAQLVMAGEVLEFLPYIFQLLASALQLAPPPPSSAASSLSPNFQAFLPQLLQPRPWQRKSSVPALVDLLRMYLERGPGEFGGAAGAPRLHAVLNIWKALLDTKGQEAFAFALLDSCTVALPGEALAPHMPLLLPAMLTCVQLSKAVRIARCFIHSTALMCAVAGPGPLVAHMAALSPGLLPQLLEAVYAPLAERVLGRGARQEAALGLTRLLCETPSLLAGPEYGPWVKLLGGVLSLLGGAGGGGSGAGAGAGGGPAARAALLGGSASFMEDEDLPEEVEGSVAQEEYTSSYNRLVYCALPQSSTLVASYPAPPLFLSQSLARLAAAHPAAQGIIAASTYAAAVAALPKA